LLSAPTQPPTASPPTRSTASFPTPTGFIWFCTPEGLTRFDGYRMVTFGTRDGFPHRAVQDFLETRTGEFLVATPRGLCRPRTTSRR
jgi:hypothetical protein